MTVTTRQKWDPIVIFRDHPVVFVHKGRKHLWIACGDNSGTVKRSLFKLYGDFVFGTDKTR